MNILARVKKLEGLSGINSLAPFERIICNDNESSENAAKRLGIDLDDGVNRIFRVIVEPNHN